MQKIYFVIALFFTVNFLQAQVYDGPESVEEDPTDGSVFVSNAGGGTIVRLMPNGTLQSFATGFTSGPHGLELIGDTLYVCDGGYIRLVNRTTGAIINSVNLSGSFLNGITHKGKNLFITDFSAKRIYRLNTQNNSFNIFTTTLTKTPNGIIYDYLNDRLVYCCWGSSAPVYQVNLADSSILLLATTATGNCDGIAMNCQGQFYISSWSPNAIKRYPSNFSSVVTETVPGLSSPADIFFTSNDTLIVPNSGSNTVSKTNFTSCLTSTTDISKNSTNVYPNPVIDFLSIENANSFTRVNLFDVLGQIVLSVELTQGLNKINLQSLKPGSYFAKLSGSDKNMETIKVTKK
jgi:sugar lactone lactonase YvrE